MFNSRIVRQQGASEMSFASGASLVFQPGAAWTGTIGGTPTFADAVTLTQTAGSRSHGTATLTEYKAGACLSFNMTGPSMTTLRFINGVSTPGILVGQDATSALWAPAGSLYIRMNGASTAALYINVSQDTAGGSTWNQFDKTSSLA